MKAEGSNAPIIALQKVKVKEEAKECCNQQQQRSPKSNDRINGVALLTPMVTSSAGLSTNTICTSAIVSNNSSTEATTSNISSSSSGANGKANTGQSSTTINSTTTSTFTTREPLPIDLKTKAVSSQQLIQQPEKSTRDEANHDVHNHHLKDNRSSPNSYHKTKLQQQHSGANAQLSSSSLSENDSLNSLHSIKPEGEDIAAVPSRQNDENASSSDTTSTAAGATSTCTNSSSSSSSSGGGGGGGGGGGNSNSNGGLRCISTVFAGHTKLKRLLGTLVQFANNISTETGDVVRTLVLNVLSGGLTAEEFHTALQDATNFPLRDFVLPYLRHTLPTLRRNLNTAAIVNNQSCVQYLRANEAALLESVSLVSSGETVEPFREQSNGNAGNVSGSSINNYSMRSNSNNIGPTMHHVNSSSTGSQHHYSGATNLATKRRASDTPYYETGLGSEDTPVYGKRSINSWNHHQQQQLQSSDSYCWYHPLHSSGSTIQSHVQSHGHGTSLVPPHLVQITQLSSFNPSAHPSQQNHMNTSTQNSLSLDDEWKNIHVMLNCILGMVDKTKRALVILQRRGCSSPAATSPNTPGHATQNINGNSNGNVTTTTTTTTTTNDGQIETMIERDGNLKRLSGEIVAQTIRATEDRVAAEVKRRTEEAVQEVKRAAMAEVQRAVAAAVAESRANERLRVHQLLDIPLAQRNHGHTRQSAFLRINSHINSEMTSKTSAADDDKEGVHLSNVVGSSCWNCGRPALETCGGCGIARYCGSFCQHRDWEAGGHHATCNSNPPSESPRSSSRSPPRINNNVCSNNGDADIGNTNTSVITKEK